MNRERTIQYRFFWVVATIAAPVLVLFASCNILGSKNTDNCGPGVIVPGICIDGIKLGDSRERVDELLGEPVTVGWADGIYKSHRFYQYKPSGTEGLGFNIMFIEEEDLSFGPVDALSVHAPYSGKTLEGIGIGSTLSEVIEAYGESELVTETQLKNGKTIVRYRYCMNSKKFNISTLDEVVEVFFTGYFIPLEEDPMNPCK